MKKHYKVKWCDSKWEKQWTIDKKFMLFIEWLYQFDWMTLYHFDWMTPHQFDRMKNKKALNQQRNCYNWNSIVIKINNHSNLVAFLILFFSFIESTELLKTLQNNSAKQSCFVMIENLLFSSLFWCPNNINN